MHFFSLMALIGVTLALGIAGVFVSKLLLALMAKSLVILIMAVAGFALVYAVIRLNSREGDEKAEVPIVPMNCGVGNPVIISHSDPARIKNFIVVVKISCHKDVYILVLRFFAEPGCKHLPSGSPGRVPPGCCNSREASHGFPGG